MKPMTGPRIVRIEEPERKTRVKRDHSTGIKKHPTTKQWAAVRDGRLIGEYGTGIDGRRVAARVAGTSQEL